MQYARLRGLIKQTADDRGDETVTMPAVLFRHFLAVALEAKKGFDEKFYLAANPDVKQAVANGVIDSGLAHYVNTGYFEDKLPRKILIDEKFYLSANPDIADAIKKGAIDNAQRHFESHGFREGRLPFAGFALL